eukprot:CAMPEP_0182514332 /NCGR_PEP_ID=MMETSP1321-20130603/35545_1 /TAXON_ID=91990 /ORGANISM="Bolidomonas sp., Strain RCC1657" /LENGTH=184 /DNA_ID=CAMNT_0024721507 /DNA_START=28 /DNA_END=582 /DNA_ORIENTATION=-
MSALASESCVLLEIDDAKIRKLGGEGWPNLHAPSISLSCRCVQKLHQNSADDVKERIREFNGNPKCQLHGLNLLARPSFVQKSIDPLATDFFVVLSDPIVIVCIFHPREGGVKGEASDQRFTLVKLVGCFSDNAPVLVIELVKVAHVPKENVLDLLHVLNVESASGSEFAFHLSSAVPKEKAGK